MAAPVKSPQKHRKLDELMESASQALAKANCFEAERLAEKALMLARQEGDYERMARIVTPLMEARRQRMQMAVEVGRVRILEESVTEDMKIEPGCHLIQPPQVGADGRRLRLAALQQEIPVAVLCREPLTQLKQVPVVALGPGVTIRTKIAGPKSASKPDMAWFLGAIEQLGDWAIQSLDGAMSAVRRVDALLERLDALPDHEDLHHALQAACREAACEQAEEAKKPKTVRAKAKPADESSEVQDDADDDVD